MAGASYNRAVGEVGRAARALSLGLLLGTLLVAVARRRDTRR